jgi:hypothetical protein
VDPVGGEANDLFFTFNNDEQLAAWKFEGDGDNSGGVEIDKAAKTLLLKVNGEHGWDTGKGRHPPIFQIPFNFNPNNWYVEADTHLLKSHAHDKKDQNPNFGIFISDGGSTVVRLSAKEARKGDIHIVAQGGNCNEKETQGHIPGKQEEHFKLRIQGSAGVLSFSAVSQTRQIGFGRVRFSFEPKFVGVFLETHDKDEAAVAAFDNVRIAGAFDKEKIKAVIEARRIAEISAVKNELLHLQKPAAPKQ